MTRLSSTMAQGSRKRVTQPRAAKTVPMAAAGIATFFFMIRRPSSGKDMAAHTEAVLRFTGMRQRNVWQKALVRLLGNRAVAYHLSIGNFASRGVTSKLAMTPTGEVFFRQRLEKDGIDERMIAAYHAAIAKGKTSDEFGIEEQNLAKTEIAVA